MPQLAKVRLALLALVALVLSGCPMGASAPMAVDRPPPVIDHAKEPVRTLRVAVPFADVSAVPRTGSPADRELALVELFARSLGAKVQYVRIPRYAGLIDALLSGKADLIAAQMTRTPSRSKRVAFSSPTRHVREVVVVPKTARKVPSKARHLGGRKLWLRASSSYMETVLAVQHTFGEPPHIVAVPEELDTQSVLARVGSGQYPLTISDSDEVETYLSYRDDIREAFVLNKDAPISLAVRPGDDWLLNKINRFLAATGAGMPGHEAHTGDLDAIRKRGILRVVMPNNATSYFFYRGIPMGFQHALARRLAKHLGVHLEVIVPRRQRDMIQLVREGRADLAAATLTITDERAALIDFSKPLMSVDELLIQRAGAKAVTSPEQLAQRTITVRRSSSYWQTLAALKGSVPGLKIVPADEALSTEELIEQVATGATDLTVADYNIVAVEMAFRSKVQGSLVVGRGRRLAYGLRKGSPKLKEAVDAFVTEESRRMARQSLDPFGAPHRARAAKGADAHPVPPGALSAFDAEAVKYGTQYGIDWRLIVAQMAVESGFDPTAENWVGARGLLMVMPHVAQRLGFRSADLGSPDTAVHVGVKILAGLRDRFESTLPAEERLLFAIAAYRTGFGHVADARHLARTLKLDPNRWSGHTEKAMRLLSRADYADRARYGYCRGAEVADYVASVDARFKENVQNHD